MKFLLVVYHLNSLCKKLVYKLIYRKRLKFNGSVSWRKGFSVLIERNAKVIIGKNCFFNNYCSLMCREEIIIGNGTLLGENVKVYDHNHRFNKLNVPIKEQGFSTAPVVIGSHCWIGSNAVILKGVHIGNNVVIGAGCVISKNVKDNTIVKQNDSVLEEIPLIARD